MLYLSDNYFTGYLPISGNQSKMTILDLSGNEFRGHIPSDIDKMQSLEEIMLYNNRLTGTLPIQITKLKNALRISLSYNDLKGTIPSEIAKMEYLNLLHLHGNRLTGTLDIRRSVESITDCGETPAIPNLVECDDCSFCCNEKEDCFARNKTWPKIGGLLQRQSSMSGATITILFLTASFLFFGMICFVVRHFINKSILPKLPFVVRGTFQEKSVHRFLISGSLLAWFLGILSMAIQIFIYAQFLKAADGKTTENDLEYIFSCPRDSLVCQTSSKLDRWGIFVCGLIIFLFILDDLVDGFLIIYEGITISDKRGIAAGIFLLYVTLMTMVTSMLYNNAICTSNTELFMNSAVLLFLNDLDDKIYSALEKIFPLWLDRLEAVNVKQSSILQSRLDSTVEKQSGPQDDISKKSSNIPRFRSLFTQRAKSTMKPIFTCWSNFRTVIFDKEKMEEENPMVLMKRTKEKIDKLQEELVSVLRELESVRTDFTKLSSLDFSGCNQVDGEKIGFDGEEEKIPEISDSF